MFRRDSNGGPDPSCPGVVQAQQEAQVRHGAKSAQGLMVQAQQEAQVRHGAKSAQGLISSVSDPYWIRIQSGQWIRIQIRIWNPDSDTDGGPDPSCPGLVQAQQ